MPDPKQVFDMFQLIDLTKIIEMTQQKWSELQERVIIDFFP